MMRFTGKHGIVHEVPITDRNLKRIVAKCQDLPGQLLFQYVDGDGEPQPSPRPTSTTISAKRPAAISPPRISAPGARASSPSTRC